MSKTILLTGGAGFLGTELAARLIRNPGLRTYVLIRSDSEKEAYHRARCAWFHDRELYQAVGERIFPVSGDFTKPGLGLDKPSQDFLRHTVTHVLHAGAEIGFQKSRQALFETNTTGTAHMLEFAAGLTVLRRFVHISTAYAAGQKRGLVTEEEAPGTAFSSHYEESKAEAERLVRASCLPFSICRPGMIVGDSQTGWVRNFNTIYYVLKQMLLGRMRVFPMGADTPLNLVPGDYVADCVVEIAFSGEAEGKTFHLTCPKESVPRAGELAEYVRDWAKQNLSVSLPKPLFVPLPFLKGAGLLHNRREGGKNKNTASNFLTLLPYFFGEQEFDRTNTDRICGPYPLSWRGCIDPLLEFACRKNFMRQTERTVFEQALIRRESRRFPIAYYDITGYGIQKVTGPEANRRIGEIQSALWAWGVRKGDRIALTGVNSVAYMVLEQAIGLLGAVSVPIYYTTPPKETALLLRKSGAKWFFIGDRRMMDQLEELDTTARIVSFSVGEGIRHPAALPWAQFLSRAVEPAPPQYPGPEDLATIRYTSGTTGEPKGVTFRYGQLAWMGETLAGLLPWEDRNRALRYLSFLPLSHVVEGILASYAPYYTLARVDYYCLNDFNALADALPKVRPNVFFSVPRFYEKVWNQAAATRFGRAWLAAKEGPAEHRTATALLYTPAAKKSL
ncbi:MAG: SDR family oxidoreductase [Oscillibacter sp.]|nr:SDR family oxidoreductase [Oscillibacter sp.]